MTIPRLSGWWDEIQPYAKGITDVLEQKFYPNKRLQLAMQAEVSKNPALLQQFADLKARDPEILRKIGLNNIDMMVGGLPESAESIAEKKKAGILASPTTSEEEPEIRAGVLGTKTPIERQTEQARLRGYNISNEMEALNKRIREFLEPSIKTQGLAEGARSQRDLDLLLKAPLAIKARQKIGNDYSKARELLTPEEYDLLSTHPDTAPGFEKLRDDYWNREREKFSIRMSASERRSNLEFSLMGRWAEQIADYGGTDPMSVLRFTTLPPDEQKRIREAAAPLTPEEEALWRAGRGMNALKEKYEVSLQRNVIDIFYKDPTFNTSIKTLQRKGATPNDKQAAIAVINGVMAAKGRELGIPNPPQWELKQTHTGWFGLGSVKVEPTLISGDLGLSEAIARESGITVNTLAETEKKSEEDKVLSDPKALDARAEMLAKDLSAAKTEVEKQAIHNEARRMLGDRVYAETRNRLSKFGVK